MHELRIAEDLSVIVLETAKMEKLSKVTRVNVSFGQLVQIVPDIFEFAFRQTVKDSIAGHAELNIEIIAVRMKCSDCGSNFQLEKNQFFCNNCGSSDIEIINGKELFIKSIEGKKVWK
jgi:hydrogenase nickel incorporation protein HypA/HybF